MKKNGAFYFKLVSKNSDLVVKNLGNYVSDLNNKVADTGEEAEKTCNKGNNVLGLGVTDNSVYAADNPAEDDEEHNLNKLRKVLKLLGDRIGCHRFSPYVDLQNSSAE